MSDYHKIGIHGVLCKIISFALSCGFGFDGPVFLSMIVNYINA